MLAALSASSCDTTAGNALGRRLAGESINLALHELPIKTVALQEVGRTVLNDLTKLEHDDPVEVPHHGEPVGDGDDRAAVHQAAERLADCFLGFAVER